MKVKKMIDDRMKKKKEKKGRIEKMLKRVKERYGRDVGWCMRKRIMVMMILVMSFMGYVW